MTSPLLATLRRARDLVASAATVESGEAAMARRIVRDLDEGIARLAGADADHDLLSIVCHDLKDPLASIVMGAGFLKKTLSSADASSLRVVDAIGRSADRMALVVGDFHDLARLEAGRMQLDRRPCDVVALLQGAKTSFEAQASPQGVRLELELPPVPLTALCDRARLTQIVSKLVANAVKFTPPQGRVTIRVDREGQQVRVSVADTGRGIAPDRLPTIFDRRANARRTPRDGPGLGLAIVQGLVEGHGGNVHVESRVGEGSVFSFLLDYVSSTASKV